jgi:ectoine hydroxylase-related dioxygenase (phytanoyl-CoA dioxygenase family)
VTHTDVTSDLRADDDHLPGNVGLKEIVVRSIVNGCPPVRSAFQKRQAALARAAITPDQVQQYHRDGFLTVRSVLSYGEVALIKRAADEDRAADQQAAATGDNDGAKRLSTWFDPSDTIYGAVARSESVVEAAEKLLGDEAYHFQSQMALKEAQAGAASSWHQDYAAWYHDGVLFPDLVVAFMAIDPATRQNGCLQIIEGSQRLGRIDHDMSAKQPCADPHRVADILKRLPLVHVTMEPGDVVYFHANTLHRSDKNTSDDPRWSMLCFYNSRSNAPDQGLDYWRYRQLIKVPDAAIMAAGNERFAAAL